MTNQVIDDLCGCCALTKPVTEALSRRSEKKKFWNVHTVVDDSRVGSFLKSANPFLAHALTHSKRPLDLFFGKNLPASPVSSHKYRKVPPFLGAGGLSTGKRKQEGNGSLEALVSLANELEREERSTDLLVISDSQVQSKEFHHTRRASEEEEKRGYILHSERPRSFSGDTRIVAAEQGLQRPDSISSCWNLPSQRFRKHHFSTARQQGANKRSHHHHHQQHEQRNFLVQRSTWDTTWFPESAAPSCGKATENFHVAMPSLLEEHKNVDLLPLGLQNAITYLAVTKFPKEGKQNKRKWLLPPQQPKFSNSLTLVLDMDETLMHCSIQPLETHPDFLVHFADTNLLGNVYIRPFAKLFLDLVSQLCEIVVFTASTQAYADQVLAQLDPENRFVHHRLYRQHCTVINGGHVKDLRLLGRDASKTILADNSPISMALQPDNGIIVSTWTTDYEDKELMDLLMLIQHIATLTNVPEFLRSRYGFRKWINRVRPPHHPL